MTYRYTTSTVAFFTMALTSAGQGQPGCWSVASSVGEAFTDVQATSDGGSYAIGSGGPGTANEQAFVVRLDANAQIVWSRSIGSTGKEKAVSGSVTADGGIVICGYTDSHTTPFNFDMFVARLSAQGDVTWVTVIENPGADVASAIAPVAGGGWLVTGEVHAVNGGHLALLKIADDGALVFSKRLNGGSLTRGSGIIALSDGGYGIVGTHASLNGGLLLMRLDVDGEPVWRRSYAPLETQGLGIVEGEDGALVACGMISNAGTATNHTDGAILSVDVVGAPQWGIRVAGEFADLLQGIARRSDGGFLAAGRSAYELETGAYNGLLVALDANGTVTDTLTIGLPGDGAGYTALTSSGAGFIGVGFRAGVDGPLADTDAWTTRLDLFARPCPACGVNGVGNMTFPTITGNVEWTEGFVDQGTATSTTFTAVDHGAVTDWCLTTGTMDDPSSEKRPLFPNPIEDRFVVDLTGQVPSGPVDWVIHSADGKLVRTGRSSGPVLQVETGSLSSGVFLLEVNGARSPRPMRFVKR